MLYLCHVLFGPTAEASHGYIHVTRLAKEHLSLWEQEAAPQNEIFLPARSGEQHVGKPCCLRAPAAPETHLLVLSTSPR